jgi:hypothetical protein
LAECTVIEGIELGAFGSVPGVVEISAPKLGMSFIANFPATAFPASVPKSFFER